jgi:hypothetical protein
MNVREYSAILQAIIQDCPHVIHWSMEFDEITLQVGHFKGMLEFVGGSILHFIEFVETYEGEKVKRLKYKYHLQSESGELIARWDNVPHHRDISSFPHHKHDKNGVHPSEPADLKAILDIIIEGLEE